MAQVGRISGPLLQENLLRNGNNLSFKNIESSSDLLYIDVSTGRIGVDTNTPRRELEISNTLQSSNLIATASATVPYYSFENSTITAINNGDINLNGAEGVFFGAMSNSTLLFNNNDISTIISNADIDLTPHGTGTTEIINDLNVFGNIYTPGDITLEGNIIFGNESEDTIDINAEVTSDIIPDQNDTYNLGTRDKRWSDLYTNLINGRAVSTDNLEGGFINFNTRHENVLYVSTNGNDDNVGDSPLGPYKTIKRALEAADASTGGFTTIYVYPGGYEEETPLIVPENVSIIGQNIRNVIIRPESAYQSEDVFLLNGESTIVNLTIKDFYYDSLNDTGYAFKFAPNATITTRSPYIQNVTVITQGSSTSADDPRGFDAGDAGKGALVDGAQVLSTSEEASMLFHSCTFITPGVDAITMTNGVRVEWLNSFTYFANRGLYAVDGATGHLSTDGSTVKYGAEIRSIGSANVYGNYGAVADGSDTLMYLIQHNFAYIGTGKDSSNDNTLVQQEQETLELNSGKIYFQSTDQLGNFKVGNEFSINLETGETSLDISSISADALSGLIIGDEDSRTIITGEKVETGNIRFTDNSAASLVEDLNLTSADEINLLTNTSILGNLDIRDNLSFGGTLNLAGDQPTDTVSFNVEFEQNFNPNTTLSFDLGSNSKFWKNSYLSKFNAGQIQSYDNILTTDESNSNLELRAASTGKILISNNVNITNNIQVNNTTTLRNSVITYEYGPELIINGTFDTDLNGWSQVGGGSASASGGNLQINATGSARNVSQEITVIPGSTYDFSATFKNVSNSNQFYLRIFESGQGTLFEWNETSGLTNDQVLTASFTPVGTAINIIFRAVNTVVEWDNVSVIEDIGLVETIIPIDVNITGTLTHIGNSNISNNYTQTGNTSINGLVDISSKTTFTEYEIDNNVLSNISTGLYLNRDDPYNAYGLYEIVRDMAVNGATEADYPNQPEKNLITFLANGTSAPDYAFSYVDVNRSGSTTSGDALTWLQYIANGTTGNIENDALLNEITQKLLDQEFFSPGKFNGPTHDQIIILGDYGDPDLDLRASGTGKISLPTNDLRITNNLFVNYIEANNLNVLDNLSITQLFTKDSPINIGDNYVRSISSNADLELRAEKDVRLLSSTRLGQNLEVGANTSIRSLSTTGNIAQSGLKLQTGDYSVIGNITVSSISTNSEIQFDNILFDDNFIETTESNSDLLLISNGSGVINVPINDVRIDNDLTLSDLYSSDVTAVDLIEFNQFIASDDITIFDNVITTTNSNSNLELRTITNKNIRLEDLFFNTSNIQTSLLDINISTDNLIIDAEGALKLPSGTTSQRIVNNNSIRFNSTDNIFEAYNSAGKLVSFNGVYSSNRRTNVLTDDADSINLTVNLQQVGNVGSSGLNIHAIQTDDVRLDTNVLRTTVSNSDLDLQANGTGKLILDNISITGNTIENNYNGPISLKATGYGVYKLGLTNAVVIPYGSTVDQPSEPEVGTSRWNTDDEVLEVWDGSTFISAAGVSATISDEDFENLILEYTLIFG